MSDKKIIAVVGATGQQGGGIAHAILDDQDGGFAVRALTRNPGSAAAKALAARGAEVVAADVDDEDSLRKALDGAYGAHFVTAFWEYNDTVREQAQARNMANAAKAAGLEHVVWSTLPDTRDHLGDDERVPTLRGCPWWRRRCCWSRWWTCTCSNWGVWTGTTSTSRCGTSPAAGRTSRTDADQARPLLQRGERRGARQPRMIACERRAVWCGRI